MTQFFSPLTLKIFLTIVGSIISQPIAIAQTTPLEIAQIIPDNSLGTESSRTRPDTIKNTPSDVLEGGARRGSNLFHSFREFNIQEGRGAYFANPEVIRNIFTRVTGGNISKILGTLGVLGNANLFLINPNGIIFGPNARLDIRGAFVGSTANSLVFDNNFEFSASNPDAPPLLTVNMPIGLRFRQGAGDITSTANLSTPSNLTLQGNNLNISGSVAAGGDLNLEALNTLTIRDSITHPFFAVAGGDLRLQGNQGIDIFVLNNPASGLFSSGDMILRSANTVGGDAHYYSGGSFRIEKLDGSLGDLYSPNDPVIRSLGDVFIGAYQGASLHIIAGGSVTIPGFILITGADPQFGLQETITLNNGQQIQIDGKNNPTVDIRAGVRENAIGIPSFQGSGNDLFFEPLDLPETASSANINIGTIIFTNANTNPIATNVLLTNQYYPNSNLRGDIKINSPEFESLVEGGNIAIDSQQNVNIEGDINATSQDKGGNILINALADIKIKDSIVSVRGSEGGSISMNATNINIEGERTRVRVGIDQGLGNSSSQAGNLTLNAVGSLSVNGSIISNVVAENGEGNAGNIKIQSSSLLLADGAEIVANTLGKGNAGRIEITVFQNILITGEDSGVFSQIAPIAQGNSGGIYINTQSLSLSEGGRINTSTFGQGNAGEIRINASETISITGQDSQNFQSGVFSSVVETAEGNGGNIFIEANSLFLADGATISTRAYGKGNAGAIQIIASDFLFLDNALLSTSVGEKAQGNSNEINILGGSIFFNNSQIETDNASEGNAGKIFIQASKDVIMTDTSLFANIQDGGRGNAGNVDVKAHDGSVSLVNSNIFTNTPTQAGQGGDIAIDAQSLSLTNNSDLSSFSRGEGAGNITIIADEFVTLNNESSISIFASGNAGNVLIETAKLSVRNGSNISGSVFGDKTAGSLTINASDSVEVIGFIESPSGIVTGSKLSLDTIADGDAGRIVINTGKLVVEEGGSISTSNFGNALGTGGTILINATESVQVIGSPKAFLQSTITASTNGEGKAGNILIDTNRLIVSEGASISSFTTLLSSGQGGTIEIYADESVEIIGTRPPVNVLPTSLDTSSGGRGVAGNIRIFTGRLTIRDGAEINTSAFNRGNGGTIEIFATELVEITGASPNGFLKSQLTAETFGEGIAGNIFINAPTFNIADSAIVSARTSNAGDGGSININSPNFVNLGKNSRLTVETSDAGKAGNIIITTDTLNIGKDAELSATATETATNPQGGGSITLNASNLNISGKLGIFAETSGFSPAGTLTLQPNNNNPNLTIRFTDNGFISASTTAAGDGGSINLSAPETININGQGNIFTQTTGSGNAGNITITTNQLNINRANNLNPQPQSITISASTNSNPNLAVDPSFQYGNSGNIVLNALNFNLNNTVIQAETTTNGNPGSILIGNRGNLSQNLNLRNSTLSTEINAQGNPETAQPANITLNTHNLNLDNSKIIASTNANRNAGNINLPNAQQVNLINNSEINAFTTAEGQAGNITLNVENTLLLDSNTKLNVETFGIGNAGDINIIANTLIIGENAELSARTRQEATGKAGNITLQTNKLNISGELGIFAETEGIADAGDLTINPKPNHSDLHITFTNDGNISASTSSAGRGGNIDITAPQTLNIDGNGTIQVETSGSGNAGNINLNSQTLNFRNGLEITASTTSSGNAGNINLNANQINLSQTEINAFTDGTGNAGSISLSNRGNNANQVLLRDNSTISTEIKEQGQATIPSNIEIKTDNLTVDNSRITASTAGKGDAGSITVPNAQNISLNQSEISASTSGKGNTGLINLNASENLNLLNNSQINSSVEQGAVGDSQQITLNTPNLNLNNSQINATTAGQGNAGSISVEDSQIVRLNNSTISTEIQTTGIANEPSNITLNTQKLTLDNNSRITASTAGKGNTGLINLNASENLNLLNNSQINSSVEQGAVGDSQQITLNTPNLNLNNSQINATTAGQGNAGSISVEDSQIVRLNNSTISTEIQTTGIATQPSNITLSTRRLTLDNKSRITASTAGKGNTGLINLNASENLNLLNNSQINSSVGQGAVGDSQQITLNTPNLNLNNSQINATTAGQGNAGSISVQDSQIVRLDNSTISTEIQTTGIANQPSNITLSTRRLTLDNKSRITASTAGKGNTGLINLNASENLNLLNNSQINSSVEQGAVGDSQQITLNTPNLNLNNSQINATTAGQGNAGSISVEDSQIIRLNNSTISTEIQTTGIANEPSNITLNTQKLTLDNNSRITASTAGKGDTGLINLNAAENLNLNNSQINSSVEQGAVGDSQQITLNTPNLNLNNSQINATTAGQGNAGSISVEDSQIVRLDNSTISTEIQTTGIATQPSNITLNTRELTLENSQITASTSGQGDAGKITVNADTVTLNNQSKIETNTASQSNAGDILLNLTDNLSLNNSSIAASTDPNSTGKGGNITVNAPNFINLNQRATIQVNSQGKGDGGNIFLTTKILRLDNNSSISAITASGEGGNITLNVADRIIQRNNSPISATAGGTGNGGNITINTNFIFGRQNSGITANAFEGKGGNINITAQNLFLDRGSEVSASSQLGIDGVIDLNTPEIDPSRGLLDLPQNIIDPNSLISKNVCRQGNQSEFTVTGRGGLPSSPEQVRGSNEVSVGLIEMTNQEANIINPVSVNNRQIIPAQGWQKNAKGEIVLVAYPTDNTAGRQSNSLVICSPN